MATKQLGFSGIERVNKSTTCNEGACEEIINLRYEGNSWRTIGKKLPHGNAKIIGFKSPKIIKTIFHNTEEGEKCINVEYSATDSEYYVSLYKLSGENYVFDKSLIIFQESEGFKNLSTLNNVLIICTNERTLYYVFKENQYINIDIDGLKNNGILQMKGYTEKDINGLYKHHLYNDTSTDTSNISAIEAAYYSLIDVAKSFHLFAGLSFYRYAIKMYDGTYVYVSDIDFADTNGDSGSRLGSNIANMIFSVRIGSGNREVAFIKNTGHHEVNILFKNKDLINNLFDLNIIQSIDVFCTKPIYQFDLNCKNEQVVHQFNNLYNGRYLYWKLPINKTDIKRELESGVFYKVKSFAKSDIDSAGKITKEILYEDMEFLTSNETLTISNSLNTYIFNEPYVYNRKLHIWDYNIIMFGGYNYNTNREGLYSGSIGLNNLFPSVLRVDKSVYQIFSFTHNNKEVLIKKKIEFGIYEPNNIDVFYDSNINQYTVKWKMPRLELYPTMQDMKMSIIIEIGNKFIELFSISSTNISSNGFNYITKLYSDNGDSYFEGESYYEYMNFPSVSIIHTDTLLEGAIQSDERLHFIPNNIDLLPEINYHVRDRISYTNVMQLSETDNPFVFPYINNYSFGQSFNKILSVNAVVGQITETKFGLFPLYVFTTEGIYSMEVGQGDVSYSNSTPIRSDVLINNKTLNVGMAIMYLSQGGLFLISGRDIINISDNVKGSPDSSDIITQTKIGGNYPLGITEDVFTPINNDFLKECETALFAFDEKHNEVLIMCDNYTYVYNLTHKYFSKTEEMFDDVILSGTNSLLVKNVESLNSYEKYLYSAEEEDYSSLTKNIIITKPFNLGTRQIKKVEKLIIGMTVEEIDQSDRLPLSTYIYIFGSNDLVTYHKYKTITYDSSKKMQDIFIRRFFNSFKYGILVLMTNQKYTNISGALFEFNEVRNKIGIR